MEKMKEISDQEQRVFVSVGETYERPRDRVVANEIQYHLVNIALMV